MTDELDLVRRFRADEPHAGEEDREVQCVVAHEGLKTRPQRRFVLAQLGWFQVPVPCLGRNP